MHFADALAENVRKTSPICVGLDPDQEKLPEGVPRDPQGMHAFCRGILEAAAGIASCVKLQLASFELLRAEGMRMFWDLCTEAKERGFLVIADGKRGDIGATSEVYAEAYLGSSSPIDALTVNPYVGSDTITPFIEHCTQNNKGIFILVKTSNPTSSELQDLPTGDEVVYEVLGQLVERWGAAHLGPKTRLSCVGAVIGATYPEELRYLRTLMPHTPFLIPGYGAQGGTAEDVVHGFIPDGTGAIVSASRSIIYASHGNDWQTAARHATETMADDLKRALTLKTH